MLGGASPVREGESKIVCSLFNLTHPPSRVFKSQIHQLIKKPRSDERSFFINWWRRGELRSVAIYLNLRTIKKIESLCAPINAPASTAHGVPRYYSRPGRGKCTAKPPTNFETSTPWTPPLRVPPLCQLGTISAYYIQI